MNNLLYISVLLALILSYHELWIGVVATTVAIFIYLNSLKSAKNKIYTCLLYFGALLVGLLYLQLENYGFINKKYDSTLVLVTFIIFSSISIKVASYISKNERVEK